MANPQPENGTVKIAYDLYTALLQADITSTEHRVFLAIVALTYGCGKVRAKMSILDIRALLGKAKTSRLDRITEAFASLQMLNMISVSERDDSLIVGPQKNFDRWTEKGSTEGYIEGRGQNVSILRTIVNKYIYINTPLRSKPDKMSAHDALMVYAYSEHPYKLTSHAARAIERSKAEELYGMALSRTRSPEDAYHMVIDFIDDQRENNDNYLSKVHFQFKYLVARARQHFDSIPRKGHSTITDEQALGRRFKYNLKLRKWVPSDDKI